VTELGSAERNLLAVLADADEPTQADRERVRALVLQRVAAATGIAAATYVAGSAGVGAAGVGAAASGAAASGAAASGAAASATVPAALASSVTASSAVASTGAAAVATTAAVTWKAAIATKIAAAVVGVGVASGAGWYAVQSHSAQSQPVQSQSSAQSQSVQSQTSAPVSQPAKDPEPVAAVEPMVAAEPLEAPKTADAPAVVHRPAAVEPKANDHLNDEADLLKRAQRAINSGDTSGALALLQQHATTYPSGVLGQERIGLRAITLCRAGQRDQGVAEATRFLKGNPSSPLSERVKSSCELK
jgi:hypothetical protein